MSSPATQTLNTACQRCRRRKVKCDLMAPRCSNCARANVRCVSSGLTSSRAASSLPPGYLESLESEVSRLEAEVEKLPPGDGSNDPAATSDSVYGNNEPSHDSTAVQDPGANPFDWSTIGEVDSGSLHPRLAYGMHNMIRTAMSVDNAHPYHSRQPNSIFPSMRQSSIPPQAHPLMPVYLACYLGSVHSCLPFLNEPELRSLMESLESRNCIDSPILLMALAIGAVLSPDHGPVSAYHAIMLFEAAAERFDASSPSSSLQSVQFLLLASIFSLYNPAGGSTWHLLGLAIQLAITLGLHHRRASTQVEDYSDGGNAFWSAYVLDRLVSTSLGRPFSIVDLDITAELPRKQEETARFYSLSLLARAVSKSRTTASNSHLSKPEFELILSKLRYGESPRETHGIFRSLALQLVVLATASPSGVQKCVAEQQRGPSNPLEMHRLWLSCSEAQLRQHYPLPWVSAYVIFHAVILQKCAKALRLSQESHETSTPPVSFDAAIASLESISLNFRGMKKLVSICQLLLDPSSDQSIDKDDLEALPSEVSRSAVRMLTSLNSCRPL